MAGQHLPAMHLVFTTLHSRFGTSCSSRRSGCRSTARCCRAGFYTVRTGPLKNLVKELDGFDMSKVLQTSDWSKES